MEENDNFTFSIIIFGCLIILTLLIIYIFMKFKNLNIITKIVIFSLIIILSIIITYYLLII